MFNMYVNTGTHAAQFRQRFTLRHARRRRHLPATPADEIFDAASYAAMPLIRRRGCRTMLRHATPDVAYYARTMPFRYICCRLPAAAAACRFRHICCCR